MSGSACQLAPCDIIAALEGPRGRRSLRDRSRLSRLHLVLSCVVRASTRNENSPGRASEPHSFEVVRRPGLRCASNRSIKPRDLDCMAGGEPGTNGDVLHFSSSPLRLLAMSSVDGPPPKGVSRRCLNSASRLRGHLWRAQRRHRGCFSPSGRTVLATYVAYHGPALTDSFVVVEREMWANSNMGGPPPPTGLARVGPPAACWR